MDEKIIFTIVMAAYNSENTIDNALKSIRDQEFDQKKIEILVIDGGSSDKTRAIAHKYGAIVVENPYRLPEPAKVLGFLRAKGKYVCIMDSDEVICDRSNFQKRFVFMEKHPQIKCYRIGLRTPEKSSACCYYINAVGDPFTCFVYKLIKGGMENLIIKQSIESNDGFVGFFKPEDIKPIGDSCTVFCREFVLQNYAELLENSTTATVFEKIIDDTGFVGYIEDDFHWHYTKSSFPVFLKKLKFRVVNNVHNVEGSGYAKKANTNTKLNRRKYLYPFYCISIVFPFLDGCKMAYNYRHGVFLLHPVFAWYVLMEIVLQMLIKVIGRRADINSYG